MGPKLIPPTAQWQPPRLPLRQNFNVDALLKHLNETNPAYLGAFKIKEAAAPQQEDSANLDRIISYLHEKCNSDVEMTPTPSPRTPLSGHSAQTPVKGMKPRSQAYAEAEMTPTSSQDTSFSGHSAHTPAKGNKPNSQASTDAEMTTTPSQYPQVSGHSAQTPAKGKEPRSQTSAEPSAPRDIPIYVKEPHSETSPASSEVDEFITVQTKSQKRKLKASKSHDNPPKKVGIAAAANKSARPTSQATPAEESEDSPMEDQPREKIPPPLYIREKIRWQRILPMLDLESITLSSARSTAIGIRVQCPTSADHRSLTRLLRQENVGFHTYALPEERVLRVVIRGLPKELNVEHIKQDLLSQELPVREVHRMYNPRSKRPYDLVLVILEHSSEGKRIHKISTVCRLSGLKVESPRSNGRLGQCHRCQLYGHSARNCFAHPRCVKCLGDHGTSDCPRTQPTEEPPSCVLCRNQGHPANYRGCPKAPKEPKRRVKPVASTPEEPPQKYVDAEAPVVNQWDKPLPRHNTPAKKPVQQRQAPPTKPVPVKASTPAPQPQGSPSRNSAADRAPENFRFLRQVLASIDIEQMDVVVKDLQTNFADAMLTHWAYLKHIDSLEKHFNG